MRNELLSVMLSGGNSIDKTLVHYFLCCEPEETVQFLHSTDLQGEELIFLRVRGSLSVDVHVLMQLVFEPRRMSACLSSHKNITNSKKKAQHTIHPISNT